MKSKYKDYEYEIIYCDPSKDWREHKGTFYIDCSILCNKHFQTYAEAEKTAKLNIDDFILRIPKTKEEWLDAIESCMIWDGYESCNLDRTMAWDILQKASVYLK